MRISAVILIATLLLTGMSGCSIYKMNIRQGNIIEQEDVSQLKKGMTKAQVQFLLGKPLVNDSFDDNTWYYLNRFKNGQTGKITQQKLTINFSDGKLIKVSGDFDVPEGIKS
ncbi:outer membrane protein assembly factor BamE [Pleionea sediminis]|uniref:outer membrane protein assembly factor BamE n=1 Tax=Pleionea sediminis TaxID=2569479 RepID=UPI001186D35C|nr:outer membrane protein assembly factor BamE [Pleionea sediminis]